MAWRRTDQALAQLAEELRRRAWDRAYLAQAWRLLGPPVLDEDYMPACLQPPT